MNWTEPNKLFYLASPYTHPDPEVKAQRAEQATKAAVDLLHLGVFTFAPIAYNAPWEKYGVPGDWAFWEKFDKLFVSRCDGAIVLQLEGWDKSIGVAAEIAYAKEIGLPVYYITPLEILIKRSF